MSGDWDSLQRMARSLRNENRLYDITLRTSEGEIRCHRFVLVAYSDFFNSILQGSNQFCEFLALEDSGISHELLQILIDFMYTGEMELNSDIVSKVFETAQNLKIEKAVGYIKDHYICEDGSVSKVRLEKPKNEGRKKPGRKKKTEVETSDQNPYKEELDLDNITQEQIDAVMQSFTGRTRRQSTKRLAAVMQSVKGEDDDDDPGTVKNKAIKTYSRSPSKLTINRISGAEEQLMEKKEDLSSSSRLKSLEATSDDETSPGQADVVNEELSSLNCSLPENEDIQSENLLIVHPGTSNFKEDSMEIESHYTELNVDATSFDTKSLKTENPEEENAEEEFEGMSEPNDIGGLTAMGEPETLRQTEEIVVNVSISDAKDKDWMPKHKNSGTASPPAKKKKRYSIPGNTLEFLKKKNLLYKVQPGEGHETAGKLKEEKLIECELQPKKQYRKVGLLKKYTNPDTPDFYVCPWPDCTFKSKHSKNVYVHEKNHTGERPWGCDQCPKRFVSKKHLTLHMVTHTDSRPFSCEICAKSLRSSSALERHMLCHTGEKPFQCTSCPLAFKDKANLRKHVSLVHLGERPFECDHPGCDYVSYDKQGLERHKVRHKDLSERDSEACAICGKVLYGVRSMQTHMLTHQGKNLKCPYCTTYSTVFKQALVAHCYRKHGMDLEGNATERNYKCDKCDFATFWEHDLKFHRIKHTGVRPFHCPICDYSTVLKGSLVKHMRLHTGEQPYKCDMCNKSYTNQSGLARHKRTHTGEKPHKCEICGKKYADLKTMRTHRYAHLNVKPFICHLCNYTCTKKDVLVTHFRKVHGDGCVPPELRPKPMNKILMRVTSGQTADEIVRNIVPTGQGERQFMVMNTEEIMEQNKFLVIHEDDLLLQNAESTEQQSEQTVHALTDGGIQMAVEGDGQEVDFAAKDVMKIATAVKSEEDTKTLQYQTVPEFLNTLKTQFTAASVPSLKLDSALSLQTNADTTELTSLPAGMVMLASTDGSVLREVAFKTDMTSPEHAQNTLSALTQALMQSEGLDESTVKAIQEGTFIVQHGVPGDSEASGMEMSHPILQAQLTGKEVFSQANLINALVKESPPESDLGITSSKFTVKKTTDFQRTGEMIHLGEKDISTGTFTLSSPNKMENSTLQDNVENNSIQTMEVSISQTGPSVVNALNTVTSLNSSVYNSVGTSEELSVKPINSFGESISETILTPEQIQELSQLSAANDGKEIILKIPDSALQMSDLNRGDYVIAYVEEGVNITGENS